MDDSHHWKVSKEDGVYSSINMKINLTRSNTLFATIAVLLLYSCLPELPKEEKQAMTCYSTSAERYEAFLKDVKAGKTIMIADTAIDTVFYGDGVRAEFVKEDAKGAYGVKQIGNAGYDLYYTQLLKNNVPVSIHGVLIGAVDSCYKIENIASVTSEL